MRTFIFNHIQLFTYKLVAFSLLALCGSTAQAALIGTSGDVSILSTAPSSVARGALESDDAIFGFAEQQSTVLSSDLYVNGTGSGLFSASGAAATDSIGAGTRIDSYFFHVDSVGSTTTAVRFNGEAYFDNDILGLVFERPELNTSDTIVGLSGTTYPASATYSDFREFEVGTCGLGVADCVSVASDLRGISFDLGTTEYIDQIRVITAAKAVPEPGSLSLIAISLLGLVLGRRSARPFNRGRLTSRGTRFAA